ncbi:PREDICTED: uncharacterized protein LOC108559446 [Nicrophorus vespilloides]|uniref:Uncharacterized protein LOC108559446 n=1 Tax=Nicrophorus vespilloides TaxID=110193 RepID=A0ABM1MCD4_NICVS|nr:PREDICTED: uncharacterized protein LOC108559446 [Nicrophorus vespilloides]
MDNFDEFTFSSVDYIVSQENNFIEDEVIEIIDDEDIPTVNHETRFDFCKAIDDDKFMEIKESVESVPKISVNNKKINNISFKKEPMRRKKAVVNVQKKTFVQKKSDDFGKENKIKTETIEEKTIAKEPKTRPPILWTNEVKDLGKPITLEEELGKIKQIQEEEKKLYDVDKNASRNKVISTWNKVVYTNGIKRKADNIAENSVAKKPKTILWKNEEEDLVEPITLEEELAKIDKIQDYMRKLYDVDSYEHIKPPMKLKRWRY